MGRNGCGGRGCGGDSGQIVAVEVTHLVGTIIPLALQMSSVSLI